MRRLIIALVLLVGCTSETPLEPAVGKVLVRKHLEGHDDCGYGYRYNVMSGKYEYIYGCEWVPSEWSFAVAWDAQRFENDDDKTMRVEPAHTESGFHVTEEAYDICKVGEWVVVDGESLDCRESHP